MKLLINCVTRNRPEILARSIEATLAAIENPDTVLMISADEDDLATRGKLKWLSAPQVKVSIAPREDTLGEKYNRALPEQWDVMVNMSDYTSFTSKGFDNLILNTAEKFPDGIGMVVNHLRNASFPDAFAMTRKFVDKLGYYFPPLFPYWFSDHWALEIAQRIDRVYVVDATVAYDAAGKPPTQNLRELTWWANFFDCGYMHRRMVANTIIDGDDFAETQWRKDITKALAEHIEYRTRWINDNCRGQARDAEWAATQGGTIKPEERYLRARAKAAALVPSLLQGMEQAEQLRWAALLIPTPQVINFPQVGAR